MPSLKGKYAPLRSIFFSLKVDPIQMRFSLLQPFKIVFGDLDSKLLKMCIQWEHNAILSTFIKLLFVINFFLSDRLRHVSVTKTPILAA